jgi:two-component system response regulator HydG/two-component system response regulator AtoC
MTDPLPPSVASPLPDDTLVGASRAMREVKQYLPKVAAADCNVLITGETGTGKERVAAWIHRHSRRAARPLVSINCAAIPDGLLESELFGFERGAFTGAHTAYAGKLRQAEGGTLFFDEIGDMSPSAQAKILRAIEAKEVCQLGGRRNVPIDVRIVAATNQDLETMVANQRFRKDLYYRLDVAHIHLPPLRERAEDIPLIFEHCLAEMNVRSGRHVGAPSREALTCLLTHAWPGNVRELRNLLEAIFISPPEGGISLDDLPPRFRAHLGDSGRENNSECERLLAALFAVDWNKSKAAAALHWSRMTLYRKMAKYHIERGATPQEGRRLAGKSSRQGRAL